MIGISTESKQMKGLFKSLYDNFFCRKIEPINNDVYRYQDSAYNSGATSAYSGADPVTFYSKDRIGQVSKQVFDNEDFHEVWLTIN